MAHKFRLKVLFKVTALAALFAYGVAVAKADVQAGCMIALFAAGLTLATLFLRIPSVVWLGMIGGFVLSAIWYWWSDTYHEVVPADRFFEFVVSAIWFSIIAGISAVAAWTILGRTS